MVTGRALLGRSEAGLFPSPDLKVAQLSKFLEGLAYFPPPNPKITLFSDFGIGPSDLDKPAAPLIIGS